MIVEALVRRKAVGFFVFIVMLCDNMLENGYVMRDVVIFYV